MDLESKYNKKSPAVKRLMREALELRNATDEYCARPLDDNLFEWHFTVRGAPQSDFADGIYHGRILLPPDYPMKPPNIILLTPNGRFQTQKKICLSISGHHPETWQPSWSIRTALLALIAFMPTPGNGTIGSLDYTPHERKQLARKSQVWECDVCGKMADQLDRSTDNSNTPITSDESNLINNVIFKGEEPSEPSSTADRKLVETSAEITDSQTTCSSPSPTSAATRPPAETITADVINPPPPPPVTNLISDFTSNLLIAILVAGIAFLICRRIFLL